jgi:D-arabinan exo alpha-(1,3)/(1,5)-arabinofuranosidase (non-reducing end)
MLDAPNLLSNDLSTIDLALDSRSISFENLTGDRGAGGAAHGGRKGAPRRIIEPGEKIELANIEGPGAVRHIWMTFRRIPPQHMRAIWMEVFYDGATEPSISVPCLDFFGTPHGRPVPHHTAMTAQQEGKGFNSYLPMPFRERIRIEFTNSGPDPISFYYQLDYTLQDQLPREAGYLHVTWNRENPTTQKQDFTILEGLKGPGRFAGCNVGIRVIDPAAWYGEGEVKIYRDGDDALPTYCGTGLEDYVGTAWGMGQHTAPYAGVPVLVRDANSDDRMPDLVSFYRWHIPDPVIFHDEIRVTIQQIGIVAFKAGEEAQFEAYKRTNPAAGQGWIENPRPGYIVQGLAERTDDYCATAYVYCRDPQPVPRLNLDSALANIALLPYESLDPTALPG